MTERSERAALILAADDRPAPEAIEIPEWGGGDLYIRMLSARERDAFELSLEKGAAAQNMRARFAVLVLSDERGNRIFEDGDAEALGQKSHIVLDRIFDAGRRFNKIMTDEAELEIEVKN